jgi:hypothetical protein
MTFDPNVSLKKPFTMAIFGKVCSGKTYLIESLLPILHQNGFQTQYVQDIVDFQQLLDDNVEEKKDLKKVIIMDDCLGKISFTSLCQILRDCEYKKFSLILALQHIHYDSPDLEFLFDYFIIFLTEFFYYPKWMRYYLDDIDKKQQPYTAIVIDTEKNRSYYYVASIL